MQSVCVTAGSCQAFLQNLIVAQTSHPQSCHVCPMGGFPTIRHNQLRDVAASLLSEVHNNVAIEPRFNPSAVDR